MLLRELEAEVERDLGAFCYGVMLIFTDRLDEASSYFATAATTTTTSGVGSPRAMFGQGLVSWVRALMTFEEADQRTCLARLSEAQKCCTATSTKLLALSGASWAWFQSAQVLESEKERHQALLLARDVELVGAEISLFHGIMYFLQESKLGYVRGTMELRSGLKEFQRIGKELEFPTTLEEELAQGGSSRVAVAPVVDLTAASSEEFDGQIFFDASSEESGWGIMVSETCTLESRVRGAVDLGIGMLHVVLSQLPPKAIQFIQYLGVGSSFDRDFGLRCLRRTVDGRSAHSPVAGLVLLLFHSATLIFARGIASDLDTDEADHVLGLALEQYGSSSLFRWFKGRILRGQARLSEAIDQYDQSYRYSVAQKGPFVDLCRYELAWCSMLLQRFDTAALYFAQLAQSSDGMISGFHIYLCAICRFMHAQQLYVQAKNGRPGSASTGKYLVWLSDSICALGVVSSRPSPGWKGKPIPPEEYSKNKANAFVELVKKTVGGKAIKNTAPEQFPVNTETGAAVGQPNDWNSSSQELPLSYVIPEKSVEDVLCLLFLPTLELAYFWNAFVQLDENQRKICLNLINDTCALRQGKMSDRDIATASLFRGVLSAETDPDAAIEEFSSCIEGILIQAKPSGTFSNDERWLLSACYLERGLIQFKCAKYNQASESWKAAEEHLSQGFLFSGRLGFRLRTARKELVRKVQAVRSYS